MRRTLSVTAALLASATAACGSTDVPTILDTEKVERAIERSSIAQRGLRPRVSCPAGVYQKDGSVFSCTALLRGKGTRFVVTQTDGDGNVRYEAK